jgi:hypothetical protein
VAVVSVAGLKKASGDETAGVDAIFDVEWMSGESFLFRQAR